MTAGSPNYVHTHAHERSFAFTFAHTLYFIHTTYPGCQSASDDLNYTDGQLICIHRTYESIVRF